MPASSINYFEMHDSKNNFDAIRPAPICSEANYFMGQCRNLHISTNCYYGYGVNNQSESLQDNTDAEMMEISHSTPSKTSNLHEYNKARKRSADDSENLHSKRLRKEVQTMKSIEPETSENMQSDTSSEELLATLYWHIHGGNFYQCV